VLCGAPLAAWVAPAAMLMLVVRPLLVSRVRAAEVGSAAVRGKLLEGGRAGEQLVGGFVPFLQPD